MSEPSVAADTPALVIADLEVPGAKQRWWFLPSFVLAWFGLSLVTGALSGAAIPKVLAVSDPVHKAADFSVLAAIAGIVVIIITPLFGRLSDRTMSRWGIRKPWMLAGTVIGMAGTIGLAYTQRLVLLIIFASICEIGFGAVAMAQHALFADQIPTRTRGRISALVGVSGGLATIGAAGLVAVLPQDEQPLWFLVPGGIGCLLCLALLVGFTDIVRSEPAQSLSWKEILGSYWLSPRIYTDFAWAWVCRLAVTMSIVSVSAYLLFFIIDFLHVPVQRASAIQTEGYAFFFVGNIVMTLICGWLSDRIGRRKPIIWISCAVTAVGLLLAMSATTIPVFMIAILIVGAGQGAFIAVDVALMTEVLPSFANAGKDLGVVALAYQVPLLLVPIVAAVLLPTGGGNNYAALYVFAICMAVIGGLAILPIKKVR